MARQHRLELEIAPAGKSRHRAAHGEAVANRHEADIGLMQFLNQRHVAENVGVAHVIERLVPGEMQDKTGGIAQIGVRTALARRRRRMQRVDEGGGEAAAIDGAAVVAGVDAVLVHALADKKHADFEIGDQHGAGVLQNIDCIADVIVMAVGEQHMCHAFSRLLPPIVPGRVPAQKGIDQDVRIARIHAKCGMPVPGQLHGIVLLVGCRAAPSVAAIAQWRLFV